MSTWIDVRTASYGKVLWLADTLNRELNQHPSMYGTACEQMRKAIHELRLDTDDIRRLRPETVQVTTAKVRGTIRILEKLTLAVHSGRGIMTTDRRRALGLIKRCREELRTYIQLDLFEPKTP